MTDQNGQPVRGALASPGLVIGTHGATAVVTLLAQDLLSSAPPWEAIAAKGLLLALLLGLAYWSARDPRTFTGIGFLDRDGKE